MEEFEKEYLAALDKRIDRLDDLVMELINSIPSKAAECRKDIFKEIGKTNKDVVGLKIGLATITGAAGVVTFFIKSYLDKLMDILKNIGG